KNLKFLQNSLKTFQNFMENLGDSKVFAKKISSIFQGISTSSMNSHKKERVFPIQYHYREYVSPSPVESYAVHRRQVPQYLRKQLESLPVRLGAGEEPGR